MGVIWSADESAQFQYKLRADTEIWDTGLADWDVLLAKIEDLIGSGPSAELSGASWNAAKTLFVERIWPIVRTGKNACSWITFHLDQYTVYEQPLLADGTYLNEDAMRSAAEDLENEIYRMTHIWIFPIYPTDPDTEAGIARLTRQIITLNEVIADLHLFNQRTSSMFIEELALSKTLAAAVRSIHSGTLSANGTYVPPAGDNESWQQGLANYDANHPYDPQAVFGDRPGQYGGAQGSLTAAWDDMPADEQEQLRNIIYQYFPGLTNQEIKDLLDQMNATGCVYIADVNSLVAFFQNNPAAFQQKFGFPLYKPDGTINFDLLFAAYWCYTQTHGGPPTISLTMDYWKDFLAEHGITTTKTYKRPSTFDDYAAMSKLGTVEIGLTNFELYNLDGSPAQHVSGGHGMVVTSAGTDANGKRFFVVSSWGGKYLVYPDDYPPDDMDMGVYSYV